MKIIFYNELRFKVMWKFGDCDLIKGDDQNLVYHFRTLGFNNFRRLMSVLLKEMGGLLGIDWVWHKKAFLTSIWSIYCNIP